MKPAILILSFLLLAFSNDAEPVVDVIGNSVVPGEEYLIFTTRAEQTGFVTLGKTGNSTRNATVEVEFESETAIPVKFIQVGANTSEILTDTPLQIEFLCTGLESPAWLVVVDTAIRQTYAGVGGAKDHPGQQTYSGTFSILKPHTGLYELAFTLPIIVENSTVSWNFKLFDTEDASLLSLGKDEPYFRFELIKSADLIRTVVV